MVRTDATLVKDKSDRQSTIYNNYNEELASTHSQSIAIENLSNTYSIADELKHDINYATKKHVLYKQLFARTCNGCSIASLNYSSNNPVFEELLSDSNYLSAAGEGSVSIWELEKVILVN